MRTVLNTLAVLITILLSLNTHANAEDITNAQYLGNYDGDTVSFNIPNVPDVFGKNISVRVYGIDTPEKKSKNLC